MFCSTKTTNSVLLVIFLTSAKSAYIGVEIPDKLLSELYSSYKDALHIDEGTVSFRRVNTDSKKYQIHVMKLNEVNGHKRHNLLVKEDNSTNPIIYINNPLETKIPNAYLTYEEFKKELTDRVLRLRKQFHNNTIALFRPTAPKITKNKLRDEQVTFSLRDIIHVKVDPKLGVGISKENKSSGKPIFRSNTNAESKIVKLTADKVRTTITDLLPKKAYILSNQKMTNKTKVENPEIETSIEPSVSMNTVKFTESPQESNGKIKETNEQLNTTLDTAVESTTTEVESTTANVESTTADVESTTTEAATEPSKKTTLSKPLVWMQGENTENNKDDKNRES